jgi:hypothetical protein
VLVRVPRPAADRYGVALASLHNDSDPTAALVVGAPGRLAGTGAVELLDIRRSKR